MIPNDRRMLSSDLTNVGGVAEAQWIAHGQGSHMQITVALEVKDEYGR